MLQSDNHDDALIQRKLINLVMYKTPQILVELDSCEERGGFLLNEYFISKGLSYHWRESLAKSNYDPLCVLWEPIGFDLTGNQKKWRFTLLDLLKARRIDIHTWSIGNTKLHVLT